MGKCCSFTTEEWIMFGGALFGIAMSIWSFVSAEQAYSSLSETKNDFLMTIDHWDSKPLLDIRLVNHTDECPDDYTVGEGSQKRDVDSALGTFPGSKNWCDCRDEGFDFTYTYTQLKCDCSGVSGQSGNGWGDGACDSDESDDGCNTLSRSATATETWYTSRGSCHTNATSAGCRTDDGLDEIDLEVWKGQLWCYKRGGWSAFQRIRHSNGGSKCKKGVLCQRRSEDSSVSVCAPSQDECPLTFLHLNETSRELRISTNYSGQGSRPIVDTRMTLGSVCWKGRYGQPGRTGYNERVGETRLKGCDTDDSRFIVIDNTTETELFNENEIGVSGGLTLGDGSVSDTQYYNRSNDSIWFLSYRSEIIWKRSCPVGDITELEQRTKPLRKIESYQKSLLILNGVFGLGILGIILPFVTFAHLFDRNRDLPCIAGEGRIEKRNLALFKTTLSILAKCAKFPPLILCLVTTDSVYKFFTDSAAENCSDSLTNSTMNDVSQQIRGVRNSNYSALIADLLLLVYYFYAIIKAWRDIRKEGEESPTEEQGLHTEDIVQDGRAEGEPVQTKEHNTQQDDPMDAYCYPGPSQ